MASTTVKKEGKKSPKNRISKYDPELLNRMLKDMVLVRRVEEVAGQMYRLRKIGGFCHLYIGQEAVGTGTVFALDMKKDYILTSYRDHGLAISAGMHPNAMMAELYGKATGCSKGKGGSMHIFDAENNMLGGNGIVGSQIPVATGVAYKIMYRKEDGVVLCYFGDGAIHQGAFHESLNLAKIWNLPIIFICENNVYGMGTDFKRVSSVHDFTLKGAGYGVPSKQVNGMDVLDVYDETMEYVEKARAGEGPSFMEIKTYRFRGHSMSDPAKYRSQEELQKFKDADPINVLKQEMIDGNLITEKEYKVIDEEAKTIANDSVTFSEESPEPDADELYSDVFA